ncbi:MAG: TonB-dependent receptor [Novosphingobium sp.]|nr:MAG: TonB-dependent receptor [Novosphingobium sp.]
MHSRGRLTVHAPARRGRHNCHVTARSTLEANERSTSSCVRARAARCKSRQSHTYMSRAPSSGLSAVVAGVPNGWPTATASARTAGAAAWDRLSSLGASLGACDTAGPTLRTRPDSVCVEPDVLRSAGSAGVLGCDDAPTNIGAGCGTPPPPPAAALQAASSARTLAAEVTHARAARTPLASCAWVKRTQCTPAAEPSAASVRSAVSMATLVASVAAGGRTCMLASDAAWAACNKRCQVVYRSPSSARHANSGRPPPPPLPCGDARPARTSPARRVVLYMLLACRLGECSIGVTPPPPVRRRSAAVCAGEAKLPVRIVVRTTIGQVVGVPYIAPGSSQPVDYDYDYVSYSMGVNYRVSNSFSLFARHSLGGRAGADALLFSPAISATSGALLNEDASHDSVRQTEAGFKYRDNGVSLNLTGFYATTKGTYLPTIADSLGIKTPTLVSRSYRTYGAELEGAVRRGPFSVTGSLTVTGGEIKAAEQAALVGKEPRRQPTFLYTLTPQFDVDQFTIGANVLGQTSSYADDVNLLKMPGFTTVGVFARFRPVERIELGLNASNLFNTKAITEVNTGGGAVPATGLGTVRTLYGRLISASAQFFF